MNIPEIQAAFRHELRSLCDEETLQALPHVTRHTYLEGIANDVIAFDLDASNADEVIRGEIEHFRNLGREFEWKVFSFDSPPDLLDRLAAAGFEIGDREALVVYDLASGLGPFDIPTHCEVRHITRFEQLADFRQVAEAVFNKDYSQTTGELKEAIEQGRQGHDAYIVYINEVPASIGRLYTSSDSAFAGFYGGGTLPEYRGQGLYRAVTAARAQAAAAAGARYLQVDALPTSLPILLRLGFVHVADTWPCSLP